ncbi:prephenate dehydratase [Staphylococcus chromogenes]|nr:prephenate dehydratase [Staphylococcus chromogenes]
MDVAYLGPQGTFTEAAALQLAPGASLLPMGSPGEAVAAVSRGEAEYAVVAIENSVDGPVTSTFDALVSSDDLQIYAEVDLDVVFSIFARADSEPRTFATHPVAWQQVKGWVQSRWPDVRFLPASSNADAAHMVADGEADACAAPARAGVIYGLIPVAEGVADVAGARTRFVLVGRRGPCPERTGNDRTSVAFTLPNEPGSLVRALNEFAVRGVDLSRIESRPTRSSFGTYRFYADLIGHIDDLPVAEALRGLYLRADQLHFLGSWPAVSGGSGDTGLVGSPRLAEADDYIRSLQAKER